MKKKTWTETYYQGNVMFAKCPHCTKRIVVALPEMAKELKAWKRQTRPKNKRL